jgi:NTP pyrophosphatase (non-canonical NTP hydrolase)
LKQSFYPECCILAAKVTSLPLTLQDAQHVSWKIFKKIEAMSAPGTEKAHDPFTLLTNLLRRADEVSAAVKKLESSAPVEKQESKTMLAKQLDDLLYCVFVLAEHYGLSLEESFLEHVNDNLLGLLV